MNDGELTFTILFLMVYFSFGCLYVTKKYNNQIENQPTHLINNFIISPFCSKTILVPSHVIIEIIHEPITKPLTGINIPIQTEYNQI